ncbi:MAG TPA: tetratricopeptide repeat protein, partial [Myxococcota bacterium]
DAALVELGRLNQQENNPTAARQALERLAKEYPDSSLKSRADEILATLPPAPPGEKSDKPSEKPGDKPAAKKAP